MAKTKPSKPASKKIEKSVLNRTSGMSSKTSTPPPSPAQLLLQATTALQEGDIVTAIPLATRALSLVEVDSEDALPALNLLGEIHVELGDIAAAREYFLMAVNIDSEGEVSEDLGGGAEKFLWLAQLSEDGGEDSVGWFERGATTLRWQIQQLLETHSKKGGAASAAASAELESILEEKRRKLATALCGVVEVYMTDLSWEEDAEQKCEALVTEATMVAPGFADPWQTLASVRISQIRLEDARAALTRSLDLWKDLSPEDSAVPDFPTRVSLARLLMEAEMEDEAIEVLERLVGEDDSAVEVWYLGGWGLYILGEKQKEKEGGETYKISWISSRQWLNESMRLFKLVDHDDERLGEHAKELIALLDKDLGGPMKEGEEEDDDEGEEWESGDEEDEEMAEA
jgi:tetratricopeptide (TPR) repeat protein